MTIIQSERTATYQEHVKILIKSGAAFRCFCSADHASQRQVSSDADIDRLGHAISGCQHACHDLTPDEVDRQLSHGHTYVVRLQKDIPVPVWHDAVYGKIEVNRRSPKQNRHLPDAVLVKSDGTPTYHLANVIDDHSMSITHVIRGIEWMSSTAMHVALYNAFGWTPPVFVHVGLLTDAEGNKLSKRKLDTDIRSLRKRQNILPETATNFLALLGWRNPAKGDVMILDQMSKAVRSTSLSRCISLTEQFDLKFTRGNAIVSMSKLWFLQRHHARARIAAAGMSNEERTTTGRMTPEAQAQDTARFEELVHAVAREVETARSDVQQYVTEDECGCMSLANMTDQHSQGPLPWYICQDNSVFRPRVLRECQAVSLAQFVFLPSSSKTGRDLER